MIIRYLAGENTVSREYIKEIRSHVLSREGREWDGVKRRGSDGILWANVNGILSYPRHSRFS